MNIFGAFEEDSINHHYYFLSIPKNTEEIIIQFEGNYIDGFIGNGKKIKNTFRILDNTKNLNITENKMILICNETILKELNINDSISFAFRSKNFFNKIFSFYNIRILLKEKNKNIIYPIDSNIGNICIPEKDKNEKGYFCICRLKNNYKELSLDNYITTSNQNEKLIFDYTKITNETTKYIEESLIKIKCNETVPYIEYIFKFKNSKIVNILSTFYKNKSSFNPQIYSLEMFYLKQNVDFYYNLKHNFSSFLSYIYGNGELKYYKYTFPVNINFQRKPFLFSLNEANKNISILLYETIKNISSQAEEKGLFLFTKLKYIIRMNEIKEINQGETVREIVKVRNLPIYYYLKCEDKNENINM